MYYRKIINIDAEVDEYVDAPRIIISFRPLTTHGGEVWSSPSYNGNEIFIGSDDGFLYCLDIDGKLIWKSKLNGKIRSSSPCLSFDDDQSSSLFIGTYNGGMFCLNQSTGVIKWNKQILNLLWLLLLQ